jgi:hypothetical protein
MPDGCSICSWCLMNKSNEDNHTNQIMMMMLSQTSRGGGGRRCMPKPTAEHVAAMAQRVTISEFSSSQIFIRMWETNDEISARVAACSVPCVSQCRPVSASGRIRDCLSESMGKSVLLCNYSCWCLTVMHWWARTYGSLTERNFEAGRQTGTEGMRIGGSRWLCSTVLSSGVQSLVMRNLWASMHEREHCELFCLKNLQR